MSDDTYRKCSAHKTNGDPCGRPPIKGGSVCYHHGGAAPQVRRKAEERLRDMIDPALNSLLRIVAAAEKDSDQLRAIENILDRTGYGRTQQVVVDDAREQLAARLKEIAGD